MSRSAGPLHDTYYVVAHFWFIATLLLILALAWGIWFIIGRLLQRDDWPRLRRLSLGALTAGMVLTSTPLSGLAFPQLLGRQLFWEVSDRLAILGAVLLFLGGLATVVALVAAVTIRLKHGHGKV